MADTAADAPPDEDAGAAVPPVEAPSPLAARLAELARQAEQQAQQLELEGRTRAELEDVLQRIERHFRSEQAVRRRAEESEREAAEEMAHEREIRVRLEEELRMRCAETKETDELRATLETEHVEVEEEAKRVEAELSAARAEAKKALAILAKTEEAVRQAEAMERLKIEAEHNTRMHKLSAELQRVREELDIRTRVIGAEMVRWRAQAEAAAAAVRDAKDELMDRKRELDVTKERMDGLVEKLYVGREKGLELRGAIDSHLERFAQQHRQALAPAAAPAPAPAAAAPAGTGHLVDAVSPSPVSDAVVPLPPPPPPQEDARMDSPPPEPEQRPPEPELVQQEPPYDEPPLAAPLQPELAPPAPPPAQPRQRQPQPTLPAAKPRRPVPGASGTPPRGYADMSRGVSAGRGAKARTPS